MKYRKYALKGGGIIKARNAHDFISQLNNQSLFGYREDLLLFMKETAERCKLQTGAEISVASFDEFLFDLLYNGYAEEIK